MTSCQSILLPNIFTYWHKFLNLSHALTCLYQFYRLIGGCIKPVPLLLFPTSFFLLQAKPWKSSLIRLQHSNALAWQAFLEYIYISSMMTSLYLLPKKYEVSATSWFCYDTFVWLQIAYQHGFLFDSVQVLSSIRMLLRSWRMSWSEWEIRTTWISMRTNECSTNSERQAAWRTYLELVRSQNPTAFHW